MVKRVDIDDWRIRNTEQNQKIFRVYHKHTDGYYRLAHTSDVCFRCDDIIPETVRNFCIMLNLPL